MPTHLNWGILGTGSIAKKFATSVAQSSFGTVVAVGSRSQESADSFAAGFQIEKAYGSYDEVLAGQEVAIVYISLPHPYHAEWAIRSARTGKHILCEKPMGLNVYEAMAIAEEARDNGVFLMEAYMYRCHPIIERLLQLLKKKVIGEVQTMRLDFSFQEPCDENSRLYNKEIAGGGILDVGGYPVSLARLIAGVSKGKEFDDPVEVQGVGHIGKTGVDEYAIANLKFNGGICAQVSCGVGHKRDWDVKLYGSEGMIAFDNPWLQFPENSPAKIRIENTSGEISSEEIHFDRWMWSYEVDKVAQCLDNPEAVWPAMSVDDSLGNLKVMDTWRKALELTYPIEKNPPPIAKEPLQHGRKEKLPTAKFPGNDKNVSTIIMGTHFFESAAHANASFDDFYERGGTAFDTAWIYQYGFTEQLFGQWHTSRGVREEIFLVGKGAHTPYDDPRHIKQHITDSLERLQTDYLDLFFIHRDRLDLPVSAFVDALNEANSDGQAKAVGVSNWSPERVDEANAYARKHKLMEFTAVSNQFSLAEMIEPVWPGCLSASDAWSRKWFEERQMPLFSWSSQARGFFLENADLTTEEMQRCWVSPKNLERRKRARELAKQKNTSAMNIAVAYILHQSFPVFSIIGPQTVRETRTSTPGAHITLAPEEVCWLNLET
jgi:predicted dehydrogenase/aryl-alcohol dehydrogenase-like predicted oxidoreductase